MAEIIAQFADGRILAQKGRVMLNPTRRKTAVLFRGHPNTVHVVIRRIDQPPADKRQDKVGAM